LASWPHIQRAYSNGYRHALIIVNTRAPGFPTVYKGDGDFIDASAPDAATRRAAIQEFCQDLAAHLKATFPQMAFAYECGNEITLMVDGSGLHSLNKYLQMYKYMYLGLKAGDATCMVSPGSTLHAKTNLPPGALGSNFYNVPNTAGSHLWGPTDQVADMVNASVVGSGFTLQTLGCDFIAVHPYCAEQGPYGLFGTPKGQIGPDVPINGLREIKYIRQKLDAAGLTTVPIWITEMGFPTARYWVDMRDAGTQVQAGQVVFDPAGSAASYVSWHRGTLWQSNVTHTPTNANRPGSSGGSMWTKLTGGSSSYNGGEAVNAINEENEAGLYWSLVLRQFFGTLDDVDGVNLGKKLRPSAAPSFIYGFLAADEVAQTGFQYGLMRADGVTYKGSPYPSGPAFAWVDAAKIDDTRAATVPQPPTNVHATEGDTIAVITWDAPLDNGGSPVVQYLVTASDGSTQITTDASPGVTYTGLTNGTAYTFTVKAINAIGISSASSASNSVTPSGAAPPPDPPPTTDAVGWDVGIEWNDPAYDWLGQPVTSGGGDTPTPGPVDPPNRTLWTATLRDFTVGEGTACPWQADTPIDFGDVLYKATRTDNQQADGTSAPGRDYMGDRTITLHNFIGSNIDAGSQEAAMQLIAELNGAWRPASASEGDRMELAFTTPFGFLTSFGKPDRKPSINVTPLQYNYATAELVWHASDPRLFGDEVLVAWKLQAPTGGLGFPFGFPFGFGQSYPGLLNAHNAGTVPTPWTAVLAATTNNVQNPAIRLGDAVLRFNITLTIGGPAILLDSRTRKIVLGTNPTFADGAVRGDLLVRPGSTWFDLEPGDNFMQFSSDAGQAAGVVAFRPAWNL
jgi:hypothetical protein